MKHLKALLAVLLASASFGFASPAEAETATAADSLGDNGPGYDPSGDIRFAGLVYENNQVTLALTTAVPVNPATDWRVLNLWWHLDTNGDTSPDYSVNVGNAVGLYSNVYIGQGSNKRCSATPSYSNGTIFSTFASSCINSPAWLRVRALNIFAQGTASESFDYYPEAVGTWCCKAYSNDTRPPARSGYWMLSEDGSVFAFGDARTYGVSSGLLPKAVDIEPTPSGLGYWVLYDNGSVGAFGDAKWMNAASGDYPDDSKLVSLSATPKGDGYWLFDKKGKVYAFGAARRFGDMSATPLNSPILDSVATPSGNGYYMVASDGGIFSFGDAKFHGSMGGHKLNAPVQSLVPDGDGVGYWLVASDGGIFAFDAPFRGSMGGTRLNKPVTGMVRFGNGYLMVGEDGGIFNFSDQAFFGSLGGTSLGRPIVAVAVLDFEP